MTPTRRLSGEELPGPFDFPTLHIEAVKEVVQLNFVWQLDVAVVQALHDLLHRQPLFLEFRRVLVAVLSADLRLFRFAFRRDSRDVDFTAGHDWRRPATPWNLLKPFDVLRLRPMLCEFCV